MNKEKPYAWSFIEIGREEAEHTVFPSYQKALEFAKERFPDPNRLAYYQERENNKSCYDDYGQRSGFYEWFGNNECRITYLNDEVAKKEFLKEDFEKAFEEHKEWLIKDNQETEERYKRFNDIWMRGSQPIFKPRDLSEKAISDYVIHQHNLKAYYWK